MLLNRMSFPLLKSTRNFHAKNICQGKNQLVNAFIKMGDKFGQTKKKKRPNFAANVGQPDSSVKSVIQEKRRRFIRRENALNKVFMCHITDFMSDGQISDVFRGKGIEISTVKVSPDFQILFVSWIAKQGEDELEIQRLLDSFAYPIRDQLSQLRVVGNVPRIVFVKDKYKACLSELNELLNRADYGEDFTPLYPSLFKTDYMKLSESKVVEDLALDDLNTMPPMRNDVFRVDYDSIMSVVEKAVQKSKALHRKGGLESNVGDPIILGNNKPVEIQSHGSDLNAEPTLSYVEYMRAQKVAKSKAREMKMKEMLESERELSERLRQMETVWEEEDDYLDEESDDEDSVGNNK